MKLGFSRLTVISALLPLALAGIGRAGTSADGSERLGRPEPPAPMDSELGRLLATARSAPSVAGAAGVVLATPEGLLLADPASGTLQHVGPAGPATAVAADPVSGRIVAAVDGHLVESLDGGRTFTMSEVDLPSAVGGALSLAVSGRTLVAGAGTGGALVWSGGQWERGVAGIPKGIGPAPVAVLKALATFPTRAGVVVAVTDAMEVLRSEDGGLTWVAGMPGSGLPNHWRLGTPRLVALGADLPDTLVLARGHAATSAGASWSLYRSDDAGATWRPIAKELDLREAVDWLRPLPGDPDRIEVGTASAGHVVSAR